MHALVPQTSAGGLMDALLGSGRLSSQAAAEIFLLDCHIAGTRYYDARSASERLAVGVPLRFQREPANSHDALAIEVYLAGPDSLKLGYVPRKHNPVLARLMDAGKEIIARVSQAEGGLWGEPRMEIHLRDW